LFDIEQTTAGVNNENAKDTTKMSEPEVAQEEETINFKLLK